MKSKTALYAAVGAPVVAARKVNERITEIRSSLNKEANSFGKTANKRVNVWATEGEKVVNRIADGKMVDELTAKVDFDQVSNQVSKLRDQLEDLLSTWRSSFRPESAVRVDAPTASVKYGTMTKPVKKTAVHKPVVKKTTAHKTTAPKTAAKKASAKKAPKKAAPKAAVKTAVAKAAVAKKAAARKTATAVS